MKSLINILELPVRLAFFLASGLNSDAVSSREKSGG
jgi:hypothetical protein